MKRPACLFLLLCCGLAWANVPPEPLRSLTAPVGRFGWNDYDSLDRLDSTALANRWGYRTDNLGLRTNITRNLGLTNSTVSVGYDAIGQLTSWSAAEPTNVLRLNEQFGFGYDPAHNLHSRTSGALTQTFNTDPLNQLTNITRTGPLTLSGATPVPPTNVTVNGQAAQIYGDFTFARTNLSLTSGLNTFTNVARNTYGQAATNIIISSLPSSISLQYDLNGNLTTDGTRCFAYDPENELISVWVANTWRSDFVYDGLRRRRIERDYGWQGSTWGAPTNETRYVYDGPLVIQERDGSNAVLATHTRGPDLSGSFSGAGGIGGLLALSVPSTNGALAHYYYHADGAGNVTGLIDSNENMAARYLYGAFGKPTAQWGPMAGANAMQFSSMPYLRNAGTVGYWGRPYEPNLQRWLTPDPIGEAGGINLYQFAWNSPVNVVDPYGLDNWFTRLMDTIVSPITTPFITGPARLTGENNLNSMLERLADQRGYGNGNEFLMDLNKNSGGTATAGQPGSASAMAEEAKGLSQLYLAAATSVTPTGAGAKCVNLLLPGGKALGQAGSRAAIRELQGDLKEAQALFDELAQGGKVLPNSTYPGTLVQLPNGGTVGLRTAMTQSPGTAATIDVNIANVPISKIKFNP